MTAPQLPDSDADLAEIRQVLAQAGVSSDDEVLGQVLKLIRDEDLLDEAFEAIQVLQALDRAA
jgi:ribosomal protein L12E/L44/L45/RPP1/RPP2